MTPERCWKNVGEKIEEVKWHHSTPHVRQAYSDEVWSHGEAEEYTMPGILKPQTDERENFHKRPCPLPKPHPCTSIIASHEHARKPYPPPIPHTLTPYSVQLATAMHHCRHGCLVHICMRANLSYKPSKSLCGSKWYLMLHLLFGLLLESWCWKGISWSRTGRSKSNKLPKDKDFTRNTPTLYQTFPNEMIFYILISCHTRRSFVILQ